MDEFLKLQKRIVQSMEDENYAEALDDLVWMHDHPMVGMLSSEAIRRGSGFFIWAHLGKVYPPALESMRAKLLEKIEHLRIHPDDKYVAADAGAMQQALQHVENYPDE